MEWTIFKYKSGCNPYIAKTQKEAERIKIKYKNKIKKIKDNFFYIIDI